MAEAITLSAPGAVAAPESLARAAAVATGIGGEAGEALFAAGRAAFAGALGVTSAACAIIALGTALLVAIVLRRMPAGH